MCGGCGRKDHVAEAIQDQRELDREVARLRTSSPGQIDNIITAYEGRGALARAWYSVRHPLENYRFRREYEAARQIREARLKTS